MKVTNLYYTGKILIVLLGVNEYMLKKIKLAIVVCNNLKFKVLNDIRLQPNLSGTVKMKRDKTIGHKKDMFFFFLFFLANKKDMLSLKIKRYEKV